MKRIKQWTAKRAGTAITIDGVVHAPGQAGDGEAIKVTGVVEIVAGLPFPIATGGDGECFELTD